MKRASRCAGCARKRRPRSFRRTNELAEAYSRVALALREKKRSADEGIRALGLLAKAMAAGGASAGQTKQAMDTLADGFVRGKLSMDQFFRLVDDAPLLMEEFQRQTGKSTLELRRMAEMGKISGDTIVTVLLNAADRIEQRFSQVPAKVGGEFKLWIDGLTERTGELADSLVRSGQNAYSNINTFLQLLRVARHAYRLSSG
jgi:tape measure domain-containing protein